MLRDCWFPLVMVLVAWTYFDLIEGQRDTARSERDIAQLEVTGLREAARISGEMLADRDENDRTRTEALNHALSENNDLRRAVDDGRQRLRVKATCSSPKPDQTGSGGVADAAPPELTADARSDYFILRDQLALSREMILGLQDHVRRICLR
ncbi:lysis protein [Pseudomonas sp. FSL W7-0098]|uniref:lysis protein n=1 Tax=Pseudomonas sp. FSL W7-0098 TaxID=2496120 RepID=UPI00110C8E2C|nr:lysis protein [Pseudomonas sp. FSL W7-0098]